MSRCRFLRDIAGICRHFAVANLFDLKDRIFALPGYCIDVCRCGELCRVGCIARNGSNFGSPTLKCVGVLSRSCLCRSCACVCRLCAVGNLCALKNSIAVFPCYGVFSENRIELCCVDCIACNGSNFGSPALKCVGVLSCSRLSRSCACVCRLCAIGNLCALKNCVAVLPCYGVFSENRIELCCVGCIARNGSNFGSPALEAVCVLSCSCLSRSCARVGRLCAVGNLAALKNSIAVLPSYGVFSENRIELCRVGCIARNGSNFGSPALECVSVLSGCRLSRSCACVCRLCAVGNLAALKNSVAVLPCDCICVYFPLCVKNGVFADVYSCAVCVSRSASVGTRVPALKSVARTGEAVGVKFGIDARFNALGLFCNAAEIRIEGNCYINRFLSAPFLVDEFY